MNPYKNIMIVANNATGLYIFRKRLIERLQEIGSNITAIVPSGSSIDELKAMGVNVIEKQMDRRGINPVKDFKLLLGYYAEIRKKNPDLVITYTIKPNIYAGIASRLQKKQYAANITGLGTAFEKKDMVNFIVTNLYKFALKKAKCVFFENSGDKEIFIEDNIVLERQVKVLNGAGVDLSHFKYLEYPNNDKFVFLFIGRVMKEKGVDELFEAMKRLVKEGNHCELHVLGSYEEHYEDQIKQYEEAGWLKYYGFQKDVRPFIAACDCFVLASYHEGMANTNLECAASGRPVITSDIPGCREAVTAESGLLCKPRDEESLYQAMTQMCCFSLEKRKQLGQNGRQHMIVNFDKEKVVDETIRYLFTDI